MNYYSWKKRLSFYWALLAVFSHLVCVFLIGWLSHNTNAHVTYIYRLPPRLPSESKGSNEVDHHINNCSFKVENYVAQLHVTVQIISSYLHYFFHHSGACQFSLTEVPSSKTLYHACSVAVDPVWSRQMTSEWHASVFSNFPFLSKSTYFLSSFILCIYLFIYFWQ